MRTEKRALEVEESLVLRLFTHKSTFNLEFSLASSLLFVGREAEGDKGGQEHLRSVVSGK